MSGGARVVSLGRHFLWLVAAAFWRPGRRVTRVVL